MKNFVDCAGYHSLLVVADGELQVTGDDTLLLVVARGVASELENLGSEVLEDCGEVDYRARLRVSQCPDNDSKTSNAPGAPAPTR